MKKCLKNEVILIGRFLIITIVGNPSNNYNILSLLLILHPENPSFSLLLLSLYRSVVKIGLGFFLTFE